MNNIIINNYSLEIVAKQGKIRKIERNGTAYYPLNGQYKLFISNDNPSRCDAHVFLGKKKIGVFRLNPWKNLTLSNKKFVFNKSNNRSLCNNDLIKVVFKPEAGSCGYGCIQEYDNYCTNFKNTTMHDGSVGPKGENGMLTEENARCMFGPSLFGPDNVLGYHKGYLQKPCDDSWSMQYQASDGSLNNALIRMGDKKFKKVPTIKDFDYSRVTTMQARLINHK